MTREELLHAEHVIATHCSAASGQAGRMVICECDLCEKAYETLDAAPLELVRAVHGFDDQELALRGPQG